MSMEKRGLSAEAKFIWRRPFSSLALGFLLLASILAGSTEAPWMAVLDDKLPAIRYGFEDHAGGHEYYQVSYLADEGRSAFRFYVFTPKMGWEGVDGFLYISPTRIRFDPTPKFKKDAFEFSKANTKYLLDSGGQIFVLSLPDGHRIPFSPWLSTDPTRKVPVGPHETAQSAVVTWMAAAFSDFSKAKQEFEEKTHRIFLYPEAAEKFKAQAAAWRAAQMKPTMPEEARTHKVLAENAIHEKNSDKAIDEYQAALNVFPTWPEGQFNLALLCGETGDYHCAVEHMQDYLELVPDAPDAQAAEDKLIVWKDNLAQSQAQAAPPAVGTSKATKK